MPNPRIPHAARTLIAQVIENDPDATWQTVGSPDGFGVRRSIAIDEAFGDLAEVLKTTEDPRIEHVSMDKGSVIVRFVPTRVADESHPFGLAAAAEIIAASKPAKKTPPRKKAEAKTSPETIVPTED